MDDDFVLRLREEINSLEEKIHKLNNFLVLHHVEFDSEVECLMVCQLEVMNAYLRILIARFKLLHKKEVK